VDDVFLVASSHSFGAVNREQFYVSISRGRERCHVFTDDAELLQRRIGDSNEHTAAVELVKLREALLKKDSRAAATWLSEWIHPKDKQLRKKSAAHCAL